jgi:hypothetical protein
MMRRGIQAQELVEEGRKEGHQGLPLEQQQQLLLLLLLLWLLLLVPPPRLVRVRTVCHVSQQGCRFLRRATHDRTQEGTPQPVGIGVAGVGFGRTSSQQSRIEDSLDT